MAAKMPSSPRRIASATPTAANSDVSTSNMSTSPGPPRNGTRRRDDDGITSQAGDDDFGASHERAAVCGTRDVLAALSAEAEHDLSDASLGNRHRHLGGSADEAGHPHLAGGLLRVEELRELIDDGRQRQARDDADARGGRMSQMVVARDHAADAERREERRHDARAEDARAAVIVLERDVVAEIVVAADDLSDEEHDEEEQEAEGGDGSVNHHPCVTLHPRLLLVNAPRRVCQDSLEMSPFLTR